MVFSFGNPVLLASLPVFCGGSALLGEGGQGSLGSVPAPESAGSLKDAEFLSESVLLEELRVGLASRRGPRADDSKAAVKALTPIFETLPKNEHEKLGSAASRYALHQYFLQRHGWSVHGLEGAPPPAGGNVSTPAGISKDNVMAYLQGQLDELQGNQGMALGQLGTLASILENLVQSEAAARLDAAYAAFGLKPSDAVSAAQAVRILEAHAAAPILGVDLARSSKAEALDVIAKIPSVYPPWAEDWMVTAEVRKKAGESDSLSRSDVRGLSENIGRLQRSLHTGQCSMMKDRLRELGRADHQEGDRVWLEDFYRGTTSGISRHFTESTAYLRDLGALDESSSQGPRLIAPNYLSSPTNCVTVSGFHSLCCVDECGGLLRNLEREIGAPAADPDRIATVIGAMNSSMVKAPRELSVVLLKRIQELAKRNAGLVPLHGPLFAQWMHRAFPHECPRVRTGSIAPSRSPFEWVEESLSKESSQGDRIHARRLNAPLSGVGPSVDEEELQFLVGSAVLAESPPSSGWLSSGQGRSLARAGMLVAAVASAAVGLFRVSKVAWEEFKAEDKPSSSSTGQPVFDSELAIRERYHV